MIRYLGLFSLKHMIFPGPRIVPTAIFHFPVPGILNIYYKLLPPFYVDLNTDMYLCICSISGGLKSSIYNKLNFLHNFLWLLIFAVLPLICDLIVKYLNEKSPFVPKNNSQD